MVDNRGRAICLTRCHAAIFVRSRGSNGPQGTSRTPSLFVTLTRCTSPPARRHPRPNTHTLLAPFVPPSRLPNHQTQAENKPNLPSNTSVRCPGSPTHTPVRWIHPQRYLPQITQSHKDIALCMELLATPPSRLSRNTRGPPTRRSSNL